MSSPEFLYKFTTAEIAPLVLANLQLQWSDPSLFNDPFDCHFPPAPNFVAADILEMMGNRLFDAMTQPEDPFIVEGTPLSEFLVNLRSVAKNRGLDRETIVSQTLKNSEERQAILRQVDESFALARERWLQTKPTLRMLCFCAAKENVLLWSHYAGGHSGAALAFRVSDSAHLTLNSTWEVKYTDKVPFYCSKEEYVDTALGLSPITSLEELIVRMVGTKALEWKYEQEWRLGIGLIEGKPSRVFIPFEPQQLSAVYLGCNMRAEYRQLILSTIQHRLKHVEVYQARRHSARFALEFDRLG